LAGLSHELRTPLTAIKIALDGLRASAAEANAEATSKLVDIGRRNIDRVVRIVEDELERLRAALHDSDEPR
jgi:signal transduction histidine kinase